MKTISGQGWIIARTTSLAQYPNHVRGTLIDPQKGRYDFIAFGAGSEKSQRSQTLLLGNLVSYTLEDRGKERFVLVETKLLSNNREIKDNPDKLNEFFLLCDVWYNLLSEEKTYPEIAELLSLLSTQKKTRHLVVVHLIHLFRSESLLPDWDTIPEEEKSDYLSTINLPHWKIGSGSQRFLSDALHHPLLFFLDKIPSPTVLKEILTLLKAAYRSYTDKEMFSLDE